MFIVRHRTLFFILGALITLIAIGSLVVFRLPLSIEFTGGSLLEVTYPEGRPNLEDVRTRLNAAGNFGEVILRESGESGILLKTHTLTPAERDALLIALSSGGETPVTEQRFNSIGPSMGAELARKAIWAFGAILLAIVLYITWAFRKVSRPVSSWVFGATVVLFLLHDVIVPAGLYALWAQFTGAQVDSLFVVAILAILGYSVNDTIVIFDRVRENLMHNEHADVAEPFDQVVGRSIMETLTRSINTSITTSLALIALVVVGSPATLNFSLMLLAGVIVGAYSSILIAAPLLVPLAKVFAKTPAKESKKNP